LIQPFQQPERVIGFFNTYQEGDGWRATNSVTLPSAPASLELCSAPWR